MLFLLHACAVQLSEWFCRKFDIKNFFGFSVLSYWKMQVSTVWDDAHHQSACNHAGMWIWTHPAAALFTWFGCLRQLLLHQDEDRAQRLVSSSSLQWTTFWRFKKPTSAKNLNAPQLLDSLYKCMQWLCLENKYDSFSKLYSFNLGP